MNPVPIITVDGPGGAGKGTLCRALAKHFSWDYLDSGALYRLLAFQAHEQGVQPEQAAALVPNMDIRFALESNEVYLNEQPVSHKIRNETVGALASEIAVREDVRAALLQKQRDFARSPGLIADGRDMGTVVFPAAALKVFLDASADERARRRERELLDAGQNAIFEKIFREICERDERDRNRLVAPLKPADDAKLLDSTGKDAQQVLHMALEFSREVGLS